MSIVRPTLKMLLAMIILTGVLYPLMITLFLQISMPYNSGGSLIQENGRLIGSELIAQKFISEHYFWPRPSVVDYNPLAPSGGSNLGPTSQKLKQEIEKRAKAFHRPSSKIPPELLYASGSGLDPHINIQTAYFQVDRVTRARFIKDQTKVIELINSLSEGWEGGYVNVFFLNQALDHQFPLQK